MLAAADGFAVALVQAEPGYGGDSHVHTHPEFLYAVDGTLRNQGQVMVRGDSYAAATGWSHTEFETEAGATYLSIFKI